MEFWKGSIPVRFNSHFKLDIIASFDTIKNYPNSYFTWEELQTQEYKAAAK